MKLLTLIYIILVMILVSLNETYSVTHKIFYPEIPEKSYREDEGFLIHILFFSLLVSLPVFVRL